MSSASVWSLGLNLGLRPEIKGLGLVKILEGLSLVWNSKSKVSVSDCNISFVMLELAK